MAAKRDEVDKDATAIASLRAALEKSSEPALRELAKPLESVEKRLRDEGKPQGAGLLWAFAVVIVVVVGGAASYWFWLRSHGDFDDKIATFGSLGDALGPIAGILSALAVLAALLSVHYQRKELEENRGEMRKQAEHLKESADAQNKLASAQRLLAKAQGQANELTKAQVISASHRSYIQAEMSYFDAYAAHAMGETGTLRSLFDETEGEVKDPRAAMVRLFQRLRDARVDAARNYKEMRTLADLPPLVVPDEGADVTSGGAPSGSDPDPNPSI